jgi:hypothetical protein
MGTEGSATESSSVTLEPSLAGTARVRGRPWPIVLLTGLAGGLAWGIVARVWMRFISDDPEFTWSGTLFIVIGFGIAGLGQSVAHLGRRAGLRRSRLTALRVFTTAGLLPLGMAAGGPMFPTVILAPLAITHSDWSRRARLLIGALAVIPVLAVGRIVVGDLPVGRAFAGILWFLIIYSVIVWAARYSLAPQLDGWRAPRPVRVVGGVLAGVAGVAIGVMAVGLEG